MTIQNIKQREILLYFNVGGRYGDDVLQQYEAMETKRLTRSLFK